MRHIPVMLNEAMDIIRPASGLSILDCTFGLGGHTQCFLSAGASVIAIDRDLSAVKLGQKMSFSRLQVFQSKFSQIISRLYPRKFNAILFDLGVSSPQLDEPERGMSFKLDGPLNFGMGMNNISAYEFINYASKEDIANVIYEYGEERKSRHIAQAIINGRTKEPIKTTTELANIVRRVVPKIGKIDPATRTFQALRIFVNNELEELKMGLEQSLQLLKSGGVICCISFHSLEDRIVKHFFRRFDRKRNMCIPTKEESDHNPRARSAKLRWIRI